MGTLNIAELKHQLSSFLQRVRAGEELVIRDRNLTIAKIVPLQGEDMDSKSWRWYRRADEAPEKGIGPQTVLGDR